MTEPAPVVLVIDDEIQIRRFLRAGLELDGFVVQEAETGTDAMRAVTLTQLDRLRDQHATHRQRRPRPRLGKLQRPHHDLESVRRHAVQPQHDAVPGDQLARRDAAAPAGSRA